MNYDLGKFVMIPRGDYDSSVTYSKLDLVYYDNKTWISKVDNNTNITPSTTNSYYWGIVCEGIQGATGTQGAAGQDGAQGAIGTQGAQGSIGAQGTTGTTGAQGAKGNNGVGSSIWTTSLTVRTDIEAIVAMSDMSGGNTPKPVVNDYLIDIKGNLFIVIALEDANCKVKYVMPLRDGERGAQGVQGVQGSKGSQGAQGSIGAQGTAPANTETFTFEMANGTTVTKTFYIIP